MGIPKRKIAAWQAELQALATRHNGLLRPDDVVRYAANPQTALHSKFTWDDTAAAHQYRLWQAREIIQVAVTTVPGLRRNFRVFVSMQDDRQEKGGGYRYMVSILGDKRRRERLLDEALSEFDRWKKRYEMLTELAEIFAARRKI